MGIKSHYKGIVMTFVSIVGVSMYVEGCNGRIPNTNVMFGVGVSLSDGMDTSWRRMSVWGVDEMMKQSIK